jgi:hypothetical protein
VLVLAAFGSRVSGVEFPKLTAEGEVNPKTDIRNPDHDARDLEPGTRGSVTNYAALRGKSTRKLIFKSPD